MGQSLDHGGEHAWIARLRRRLARNPRDPRVLVPPGDDAAVLRAAKRPLVVTTDALVEGVHFRRGWYAWRSLGALAFGVNASDLAAMGAIPTAAVMALACPPGTPVAALDGIVDGFARAARRRQTTLVGGNLTRAAELSVTITLFGTAPGRVVRRSGARPGDVLFLSGEIGRRSAAVRARLAGRSVTMRPVPDRVGLGAALASVARAMIDVSDGLVQDLGHLCRASGVAAEIELARLPVAASCRRELGRAAPVFAATAGEDYELLVAVPPRAAVRAEAIARRAGCRLTRIGRCVGGRPGVRLLGPDGRRVAMTAPGFDHFRRRTRYGR